MTILYQGDVRQLPVITRYHIPTCKMVLDQKVLDQNTEDNTYDAYPYCDQAVFPNTNPLFPTIPSQDRRPFRY